MGTRIHRQDLGGNARSRIILFEGDGAMAWHWGKLYEVLGTCDGRRTWHYTWVLASDFFAMILFLSVLDR